MANKFTDRWIENLGKRKKRTSGLAHSKPVRVKGPYVVYMLTDQDIVEDINFVKQVCFRVCFKDVLEFLFWSLRLNRICSGFPFS